MQILFPQELTPGLRVGQSPEPPDRKQPEGTLMVPLNLKLRERCQTKPGGFGLKL